MVKMYVLDTNVLIHASDAIFNFKENEVVIPIYVIEEIDKLKKEPSEVGRSARKVSRYIDSLRAEGSIADWAKLPNGGLLKVDIEKGNLHYLPDVLRNDAMDNRILAAAYELTMEHRDKEVILVTKDTNMRIKADSLGINVEDYATDRVDIQESYKGQTEVKVSDKKYAELINEIYIKPEEIVDYEPLPNEFIEVVSESDNKKYFSLKYNKAKGKLQKLTFGETEIWGIRGKNREQRCAVELLMDDDIKVVTLIGQAGTGKTLLALAAGLELVVERTKYKKLIVARPVMPMGKDIGYLPGGEKEKLRPWVQPIYDNFDFLVHNNAKENKNDVKDGEKILDSLEAMGLVKIEAITYIRGRSIPAGFIIIDEAQNLTPHEIKTIVTRAGEDTKIVFTGDPYQIDNPYLDASSNGLTYLAEKLKEEEISGHISLLKGERSKLAEIAANLL